MGGETVTQFEKLYRANFTDVYLYLKALCGDDALAEELCSETFFRAMGALKSFRGDCEVRVWLCQIGKNCYYSHLQKQKKLEHVSLEELPDERDMEQTLVDKSEAMRLHGYLHQLPEPYKEVFTLRVFGELSFRQIGEIFHKTENWACVTCHRAKQKLQREMEGSNHEP
jgi:RNA polymerase sigma-70 factor (ECF subfamily)